MSNVPKRSWINPKIEIRDSFSGKGMFATESIFSGERVVIWRGTYVGSTDAAEAKRSGKHVMQWDSDLFSVEDRGDDPSYFINHSCAGKLWMTDAFTLVAYTDISQGEEITADYALWEADLNYTSSWVCLCGVADCRKQVTGKDWLLPELRKRYQDHFSPLLNKRIAVLESK